MTEDDLNRYYTAREIKMIELRQREMRWHWFQQKYEVELAVLAVALVAASVVALGILIWLQ